MSMPKKPIRNRFSLGDRVLRSSNTVPEGTDKPLIFRGVVRTIYTVNNYFKHFKKITGGSDLVTPAMINLKLRFSNRDPSYAKYHIYEVEPDSSPGPCSFEEAACIVPGLTRYQYDMLMDRRVFACLDSDLLPEEIFDGSPNM